MCEDVIFQLKLSFIYSFLFCAGKYSVLRFILFRMRMRQVVRFVNKRPTAGLQQCR